MYLQANILRGKIYAISMIRYILSK